MTIRFEYSAAEYVEAFMDDPDRRLIFKYWWPVSLAGMAGIFLHQAPYRSLTDFLILFALTSPVTASFVLMPSFVKRSVLSRARREVSKRTDLSEVRSFTSEGFLSAPAWSEPVPWTFITKVVESTRFFFLYHAGTNEPAYVPKAAMTEARVYELRALLRRQLGSQSMLKLFASPAQVTASA